jgi:hypothetical protein
MIAAVKHGGLMMEELKFPMSTGQVCRLFRTAEHRLCNLARMGKLDVPNIGGRRMWSAEHVLKAARLLGLDSVEVRNACTATRQIGGAR